LANNGEKRPLRNRGFAISQREGIGGEGVKSRGLKREGLGGLTKRGKFGRSNVLYLTRVPERGKYLVGKWVREIWLTIGGF